MKWNITADRPVYLQLIEQLELAIVAGEYRAGARLPGVREMAAGAAVNPTPCSVRCRNWKHAAF